MEAWRRGRETIERLLDRGELERVRPSGSTARRLLDVAEAHLELARQGLDVDPDGAFQLGYDAARKACTALLAAQGLHGGPTAVEEAVIDQFGGDNGMQAFNRMSALHRLRDPTENLDLDTPPITPADTATCLEAATEIYDASRSILDSGHLGPWE